MTEHSSEAALTDAQFETLVDAAYELDEPFQTEVVFVLYAAGRLGMRAGEIAHVDESWVNWERSIIEIPSHDACTEGEHGCVCGYCKKAAEQACEYDDDLTMAEALDQRWNPKTPNSARAIPFDFDGRVEAVVEAFFDEFDGYQHSRASINRRVDRALDAAEMPRDQCWPHALRATAATFHAYRGVDVVPLQALFGWADLATAQKYIRLSGGATQQALRETHSDE